MFETRPRILVVDDDETHRFLVREALEPAGFLVRDEPNGERGVARFTQEDVDIVLLDVTMPGLDGFETCEQLRRSPKGYDVPIIMVTGRDDVEAIRKAYDAGATEFLTKPFNWLILEHRLRYMLRASRAFAEVRRNAKELETRAQALAAARDAALESSRLKSQILSNVSHELRTPLNGILGMTALLLDTEQTDEQQEYSAATREASLALVRIVDDLLDCSRIEAGRLELVLEPFRLDEAVDKALGVVAPLAKSKGLSVSTEIAPEVPLAVLGDSGRLRQVLVNLVGNAIKFTKEGGVRIAVTLDDERDGSVALGFSVSDTGIGIPHDKQKAIFEPFVQADGSSTRSFGGTGLGLAIASHIVGLMEGLLSVESRPNEGSTFRFTAWFELQDNGKRRSHDAEDAIAHELHATH